MVFFTGENKYTVDDIDLSTCTHLVYAFAVLDGSQYLIKVFDRWLDEDLGNYRKFTALKHKKPGLKTLLAIGGWTDSQNTNKYSVLVASPTLRNDFILNAINFLKYYDFDGLDLDWEYPNGFADKQNFAIFVKELKDEFDKHDLMVTAAVGATEDKANKGYDIPSLCQNLDFVHLMTYDFHGAWDSMADHHSPLYDRTSVNDNFNTDHAVKHWLTNGCPANKLVVGIPLYGRTFTLSTSTHTPPAPAVGAGNSGPILNEKGFMSYLEICTLLKNDNGYSIVQVSHKKMFYRYFFLNLAKVIYKY